MVVDSVSFERLEPPDGLDRWKMRVIVRGAGFSMRAAPLVLAVGEQHAQLIAPLVTEEGVAGIQGLLVEVPDSGEEVSVGYADGPLLATGHEFSEPPS